MGYFSNGCEGESFYALNCARCVHDAPPDSKHQCAVWMLHLSHNYDQHDAGMRELYPGVEVHGPTLKLLLDELIVRDKVDGQRCAMFVPRGDLKVTGGDVWCEAFRHHQRIEDRNSGAPCLFCMAESGALHLEMDYADA